MKKTEAQNRVATMLSGGNVCARVGRRWGKTKLCELIADDYQRQGKKVLYIGPNLSMVSCAMESLSFLGDSNIRIASAGLPTEKDFDLIILDEPAFFPVGFWEDLSTHESRSAILAIGTQDMTAPSAEVFARLPFRSGWGFYSGGIDEAYPFRGLSESIAEAKRKNPDMMFKTEFMGY